MKKRNILAILAVLVLPLFLGVGVAQAYSFKSGETATVAKGEVINHTLFAAGNTVDIAGEVSGDVFCAGQTVTISGTVHGDVICAGQSVRVTGRVDGDVRLAGQTVALGGQVTRNASAVAQSFTLENNAVVSGDLSAGGESVSVNGQVARDLALGATQAIVAGSVGRDMQAGVEKLTLGAGAKIAGNVMYTSAQDATVAQGAQIGGQTTRQEPPKEHYETARNEILYAALYTFFSLLTFAMVLAALFPRALHEVTQAGVDSPGISLLAGFLAITLGPAVILITAITIIGLPLTALVVLAWLLLLLLSGPVFGYYIGRMLMKKWSNALLIMLVGATVLFVAIMIPLLGFVVMLASAFMGSGIIVRTLVNRTPKPKYELKTIHDTQAPTSERN